MTPTQKQWLDAIADAAFAAHHIYPTMSACEAAEESNYGQSMLAREGNNLFGLKSRAHPIYGTLSLPTREYLDGKWEIVNAVWVKYPSIQACFEDRMATLKRLAVSYSHYAEALAAEDPLDYVRAVSKTWSTDPARAANVIAIYEEWLAPDTAADSLNT